MKRILVPTDFSDCSDNATRIAIELAQKSDAEILFIHFMSVPASWLSLGDNQEKLYPDITKNVKRNRSKLESYVKIAEEQGVEATSYLGFNEGYNHIINQTEEENIDLVIMGSHGAGGVKELFIGSNAQKIVRLSPVPVLIVKNKFVLNNLKDFIFVSDFELETMVQFEHIMNYAEMLGARIHMIYINTPSYFNETREIKEKMRPFKYMAGELLGNAEIIDSFVFEEGLSDFCESYPNAMIAMATHGRKGFSRVFYGSVTEKVVNHCSLPVLSLKIPQEVSVQEELTYLP